MTNTKFRKRALLSSVAMLLVALIALGSATFAWFAANPNASTQGLQLKTTAASGLVIKTTTDQTWDHETFFGVDSWENSATGHTVGQGSTGATFKNFNLQPASQKQGDPGTFYTVAAYDADHVSGYKAESAEGAGDAIDNDITEIGTLTNFLYSEDVYFRLSDGSGTEDNATVKLTGVTITPHKNNSNVYANMTKAVRVAIVDSTGALVATYATSKPTNKALAAEGKYSVKGVDSAKTAITGAAAAATNLDLTVYSGALSAATDQTAKKCTVYVYLDGEDSDCYSNNVGIVAAEKMIDNIQLDFTLETA